MTEQRIDPRKQAEQLLEQYVARQLQGLAEPEQEFLRAHADLRELLEPMLRQQSLAERFLAPTAAKPGAPKSSGPGPRLGDFRMLREIGRGGMGIVYEAEQVSLGKRVALKVLPAHLTLSERALERFQREATITAKLHHESIIDIYAIGEQEGVHYFAMEFVRGTSLDHLIERMRKESFGALRGKKIGELVAVHTEAGEARPRAEAGEPHKAVGPKAPSSSAWNKGYIETVVRMLAQVADALAHAHRAGVIHRDVKPANIIVREDGTPVLTDFGLARDEGLPAVSQTGEFAGTPHYVSPEQAMARRVRVDQRTDIFSLGATLYELLTLQRAFDGQDYHEVLAKILTKEPANPHKLNPLLAPDLVTIVLKSLEKDPDRRYQTAAAFAEDLRAFIEYRPIHARRTASVVRVWRWARRDPAKAALAALLALGGPAVGLMSWKVVSQREELLAAEERVQAAAIQDALEEGYLALAEDQPEAARASFERVLASVSAARPESIEAAAGIAWARLGQHQPQEAADFLAVLPPPLAAHPALLRLRGEALRRLGRSAEALSLEQGLSEPEDAEELFLAGLQALWLGQESEARQTGRKPGTSAGPDAPRALKLFERAIAVSRSRLAHYYFQYAWAAGLAEDRDAIQTACAALEKFWPDNFRARCYVGYAWSALDPSKAIPAYRRSLELEGGSRNKSAYVNLCKLLADAGEAAAAVEMGRKAVEYAPSHPEAHYNLANALRDDGQREEALVHYRWAVQIRPAHADAHGNLADLLWKIGVNQAAALDAHYADEGADLSPVLQQFEELGEALTESRQAVLAEPSNARKHHNLAMTQARVGQLDDAVASYRNALRCDPLLRKSHAQLASLYGRMGRLDEQLATLERWTNSLPEDPLAWNDYAWFLVDPEGAQEYRDAPEALRAARRAVDLSGGEDPSFLDTLAEALLAAGDPAEALLTEQRALDLAIEHAEQGRSEPGVREALQEKLQRFRQASAAAEHSPSGR